LGREKINFCGVWCTGRFRDPRDEEKMLIFVVSLCAHSAELYDVGGLVARRNNDSDAAVSDR
jgi:hypothetical protein